MLIQPFRMYVSICAYICQCGTFTKMLCRRFVSLHSFVLLFGDISWVPEYGKA